MNSLRVAFVDQCGAQMGGAEQMLATVIARAPAPLEPSAILFEDGAFADRLRALGAHVDVAPVPRSIGASTRERLRLGGALRIPDVALRVARLLRRQRADVVYTNSMKAHLVGAVAARAAGLPCVMHFHDLPEGLALRALQTAAVFGSRERLACSHLVRKRVGLGATTVVYAPVELERFATLPSRTQARAALGISTDEPLVALVGRINRWKGHDRFLRIAALVRREIPAHFAIVGAAVFRDADYVDELHTLAGELGLREHVTFVPWLDDVIAAYAASDINCNCSTAEPFGMTAIEAAACGVPTVCFNDSGIAEAIADADGGCAVVAGDEAAFAAAVVAYLRDPVARFGAGEAARATARRFEASRFATEVGAIIRRAAA